RRSPLAVHRVRNRQRRGDACRNAATPASRQPTHGCESLPDRRRQRTLPAVIVDAHHHFLDPARIDYPFLRLLPDLARSLCADDLAPLVRAAGVDATVCVQAADALAETEFLLDQAARADWVAGVVGWVPLADPPAAAVALDRYAAPGSRL